MRIAFPSRRTLFRKDNWTPRAVEVFATAKVMATPGLITTEHLILALEVGDTVASRAFKKLGLLISPSLTTSSPTRC